MALQRGTFSGTFAADSYRNLVDLFGLGIGGANVNGFDIIGGVIQAQVKGATLRVVPRGSTAPATTDPGTDLAVGAGLGFQMTDQWALDEIWVRNTTAGQNATVVFTGTLEV